MKTEVHVNAFRAACVAGLSALTLALSFRVRTAMLLDHQWAHFSSEVVLLRCCGMHPQCDHVSKAILGLGVLAAFVVVIASAVAFFRSKSRAACRLVAAAGMVVNLALALAAGSWGLFDDGKRDDGWTPNFPTGVEPDGDAAPSACARWVSDALTGEVYLPPVFIGFVAFVYCAFVVLKAPPDAGGDSADELVPAGGGGSYAPPPAAAREESVPW